MNTLHLSVVVIAIMCILVLYGPQLSTVYGNPDKYLEFVSKQGTTNLEATVGQGESLQLPLDTKLNKNYQIETLNLFLTGVPSNVQAWIDPNALPNQFNQDHPFNATIYIYADSNAQAGTYAIQILGKGSMKNLTTGEDVQVMNATADSSSGSNLVDFQKMQERTSLPLGLLHLTITPHGSQITMNIGSRNLNMGNFCTNDTNNGSTMCVSFPTFDEYPITISSQSKMDVKLNAVPILPGSWLKFVPQQLTVGPTPSTVKMIISGAEEPFLTAHEQKAMVIQAVSNGGNIATSFLPIIKTQNLTVINSPAPIQLGGEINPNSNGTNMETFGVVYDPTDSSKSSMPVSLSVLGLVNDSKIVPLPSWLHMYIPKPSFDLNATQPYYFLIQATTQSAPPGIHTVAIKELVDGQQFTQNVGINIMDVFYMGAGTPERLGGPAPVSNIPSNETVLSPLQQFKSGIAASDVKCSDNLVHIIKAEDNSPACVKPDSADILIKRGWAQSVIIPSGKEPHEVFPFINSNDTGKPLVNQDNQTSSALRLYLSTDSTYTNPAEAVGVDISLNNTSSTPLILTKADNWPRNDLSSGPCSNLPFGMAILKGYYTEQNMTGASSLVIYQNIPCPNPASIKSYTFQPLSSKATQECDSLFSCPVLADMKIHLKVDGFMDNNGQHRPFNVGTYTIVGGDEWGHVSIQHFTEAYATLAGVK